MAVTHNPEIKDEINLEYIFGGTAPASILQSLRLKPGVLRNSKKRVKRITLIKAKKSIDTLKGIGGAMEEKYDYRLGEEVSNT